MAAEQPSKNIPSLQVDSDGFSLALDACLDHAWQHFGRSVTDLAEIIGLPNKWLLYKWVESGKLQAAYIPALEEACGAKFVTKYLADRGGLLTFRPPVTADHETSLLALHETLLSAIQAYASANDSESHRKKAVGALAKAIETLATERKRLTSTEHLDGKAKLEAG